MKSARGYLTILVMLLALLAQVPAQAGSRQHTGESLFTMEQVVSFAKKVEKVAAAKGARAFIVGRLGTPRAELPDEVQFTHAGIAIYSRIATAGGEEIYGYAIHNLYQKPDDFSRSALFTDYPVDFFASAVELKAGIIIPSPLLQRKLIATVESGANQRLHNPRYSIISNPYSDKYQNCTEHLLDILFSAIYGTEEVRQIKANEEAYFKAQKISISPIKRLLAPVVSDEIRMSDHSGTVRTVTFTTIANFLTSYGLAQGYRLIEAEGEPVFYP